MKRIPQHFNPHLERYIYASNYTLDKRVLDAGARDGYGSNIMGNYAASIELVDNLYTQNIWLNRARKNYYKCPTNFIVSDFEKEFPEGKWDVIVAFEIIEHLENPDFFLDNIKKALVPGGILIFSLPHDADVPGHKHVYDEAAARIMMESHFNIKEWHIQDKSVIGGVPTLAVPTPLTYVGIGGVE